MRLHNPVLGSKLLKHPYGSIYQYFGESPTLYAFLNLDGHNGIDLVAAEGTPILATKGTVCEVKNTPEGYGKHIRILTEPEENDFCELTFGHLRDIYVKIGDKVEDGQIIGSMGNTGFVISGSTKFWGNAPAGRGVHLHFGVRECSLVNTGWITTYSNSTAYVKNYNNGFKGAVNPINFYEEEIKKEAMTAIQKAKEIIKKVANLLKLKWPN